jgi:hypothetical protein
MNSSSSSVIIQLLANGQNSTTVYRNLASALYDLGYIFSIEMLYIIFSHINRRHFPQHPNRAHHPPPDHALGHLSHPVCLHALRGPDRCCWQFVAGAAYGVNSCPDTVQIANTYNGQWIQSHLVIPTLNMAYYAKFLIEIAIVVD